MRREVEREEEVEGGVGGDWEGGRTPLVSGSVLREGLSEKFGPIEDRAFT